MNVERLARSEPGVTTLRDGRVGRHVRVERGRVPPKLRGRVAAWSAGGQPGTYPKGGKRPPGMDGSEDRGSCPSRGRDESETSAMRLNAWLARAGVASRRGADELIKAGRVTVNGDAGQLNTFVGARDLVELDGRPLTRQQLAYVLLNKPAGVVTTARDPQGRPTVIGLVGHAARIVPVGRLDYDTTGALLLTNDGELAHRLGHPRYEVDKVYVAEVEGDPSAEALAMLARGVELDDGSTAPAGVRRLGPGCVELTLHEGRTHQVKRMLAAVGHPVRSLRRTRYGPLTVDELSPGAWRELTRAESEALRRSAGL